MSYTQVLSANSQLMPSVSETWHVLAPSVEGDYVLRLVSSDGKLQ
jgi:hypothetical protein